MKIIFLDFDGVLNCADEDIEHIYDVNGEYGLHAPLLVSNLNKIIAATGAKIVVSSTWRLGKSLEEMKHICLSCSIKGDVIGMTDNYNAYRWIERGNEIFKWIIDNQNLLGCHHYDYEEYVILDDDNDMLYHQRNNFVHVDAEVGLTKDNVNQAIEILGEK